MPDDQVNQQIKTPSILIIEDDFLLSNMYSKKLELEGFKVFAARNGEEGIRIALEEDIDLIILDLLLPRIQGIDVLTTLRQSDKLKDTPVIALTNLVREDLKSRAFELGVKEFLVKAQQTPEEVVEIVRKYVHP